jgi:ABC-type branched-subunit amino acid transport system permease subunit
VSISCVGWEKRAVQEPDNEVITLYRFILLILAGVMGIYGITAGTFVMIIHANSLKSFGVPYLSPLSSVNIEGLKDFIIPFTVLTVYLFRRKKLVSIN